MSRLRRGEDTATGRRHCQLAGSMMVAGSRVSQLPIAASKKQTRRGEAPRASLNWRPTCDHRPKPWSASSAKSYRKYLELSGPPLVADAKYYRQRDQQKINYSSLAVNWKAAFRSLAINLSPGKLERTRTYLAARRLQIQAQLAVPADEAFDGFVFGQSERVIAAGGIGISGFGTLPELTQIGAWEQCSVLLRFVFENRDPFTFDFFGT